MEKRFTLALILSIGFLVLWFQVIKPKFFPAPPPPPPAEAPAPESRPQSGPATTSAPSARPRPAIAEKDVELVVLENEELKLTFSSLGAVMTKAELKKFTRQAKSAELLDLLHHFVDRARGLELRDLSDDTAFLEARAWKVERDPANNACTFTLEPGVGGFTGQYAVRKRIVLPPNANYADVTLGFDYRAASGRMEKPVRLTVTGGVTLDSDAYGLHELTGAESAFFGSDPTEGEKLSKATPLDLNKELKAHPATGASSDAELPRRVVALNGDRRFTADLNNYFGIYCGLTNMPPRMEAALVGVIDPEGTGRLKDALGRSRVDLDFKFNADAGKPVEHTLFLYFGPKETRLIEERLPSVHKEWVPEFGRVYADALGTFSFVGKTVLLVLRGFHWLTGNWGVAIMLLTFVVRLVLFPVNRRSQTAMVRYSEAMQKIKPELTRLQEKYKGDAKRMLAEQQRLYKENKVPMVPLGGCLPVFLQLPIFYGLFAALRASIDLRHAPFLWAADLSQPDHLIRFEHVVTNPMVYLPCTCCLPPGMSDTISGFHLLPVLMMFAWFLNQLLMPKPKNEDPQMAQQRKMMLLMPLMFGFMMYGYGAGLSLYWLTSSLLGIVESRLIKKWLPVKK